MSSDAQLTVSQVANAQMLKRSQRLRANYQYIPQSAFKMRKHFLITSDKALKKKDPKDEVPNENEEQEENKDSTSENLYSEDLLLWLVLCPDVVLFELSFLLFHLVASRKLTNLLNIPPVLPSLARFC